MSTVDATTFKANVATAATALTTALQDASASGLIAEDFANPQHPLRNIENLFNMEPSSGVITSDDAYIDAAYAGLTLNKGAGGFAEKGALNAKLVTVTMETAAPANIVLTYSRRLMEQFGIPAVADFSLVTDGAPTAILSVAITQIGIVTLTCDDDFVNGDITTIGYVKSGVSDLRSDDAVPVANLVAQAVTNNIA